MDNNVYPLAKINEKPDKHKEQYCLSQFVINMNNLSENMLNHLPPTDTRFRPDIRAFEYGDLELAA